MIALIAEELKHVLDFFTPVPNVFLGFGFLVSLFGAIFLIAIWLIVPHLINKKLSILELRIKQLEEGKTRNQFRIQQLEKEIKYRDKKIQQLEIEIKRLTLEKEQFFIKLKENGDKDKEAIKRIQLLEQENKRLKQLNLR